MMNAFFGIFRTIFKHRTLIWQLAKYRLREQYAATLLGSFWAIVQPLMTLSVFWFVFSYGLKMESPDAELPFFLILFCGLVPWMTFSEGLTSGTQAILSHQYLVKKMVFPLEILPVVQIVSSMAIHLYMISFLLILLLCYGIWPSMHWIQIVYYLFAMIFFTSGLSWILSALNVFHRDVGQSIGIILTLWFWLTPLVWPVTNLSGWPLRLAKANPMFYIVEGYRQSLLYAEPFWNHLNEGLYFWTVSILLFVIGITFFSKVKTQFSDVL